MKLQKNQSLLFLGSVAFLSIILILQVNGETNYNTFFLESEQLRLVGENYRGGERTPSPVVEPQVETQDDQVQYPLPFDENSPVSKCYSKHISTLTNSYGQILKTVESQTDIMEFDENSPFTPLTIVTDKNEVATKLIVELEAYCETNNLYPFVTRNLNILDSSDLTVRVFSTDSNYDEVKTIVQKVDVKNTNLNPNLFHKWNEIGNVTIDLKTINDKIEGSEPIDSMQRIQVSGIMKIEFQDEDKAWTWNFKIDPASSKYGSTQNSYVQVKVIPTYKNTGGSGGFDYPEPTTPETNTHTGEQEQACIALGGILSGNLCTITPETPDPETPTDTPTDQEKCNNRGGELKDGLCQIIIEKDGTDGKDNGKDNEKIDYGFLNYKKLLNCTTLDCFNDADFLPIYGIFGTILLLGVFQSKRQSRVVMIN